MLQNNDHKYVYVVVRRDIPIQHQMAQACHGALEAGKVWNEVKCDPDSLIVIGVKNQDQLLKAQRKIEAAGIKTVGFWEPDWDYGWTAFGTEPLSQEQRIHMKSFQLWNP